VAVNTASAGARANRSTDAGHPSGDERFALLDKALKRTRYEQDQLIEVLHVAQDVFGFLAPDVLHYLAQALRLPPSRVYGVATFYNAFGFDPPGDHTATICTGTACYVKGADAIVAALQQEYGIAAGQTTQDNRFTLATARCLGSCGLAPVVVLDGAVQGRLDAEGTLQAVAAAVDTPAGAPSGVDA
jgi:bidirectional [NiFe] hydrogenase diaphorase subunit